MNPAQAKLIKPDILEGNVTRLHKTDLIKIGQAKNNAN
jgi:hypothetical protein